MALPAARHLTLAGARREEVWAWGRATRVESWVCRPRSAEEVGQVFAAARAAGLTVGLRGGGQSYGDAALNGDNVCLETTAMNRILDWDPERGVVRVEPGVTVEQLWRATVGAGWWPPVVPGTMLATIGGAAAMNVHGKNHFRVGTLGEHVLGAELLLPSGELRRIGPSQHPELFHAALGGFGMLGCLTSLTLRLERVHSGWLHVEPIPVASFEEMIAVFEARRGAADFLIGWVDGIGGGGAGRGLVHQANHLAPGEDPDPAASLGARVQRLRGAVLGVVPAALAWRLARPFVTDVGVAAVNAVQYRLGRLAGGRRRRQSHVEFAFLLNRFPGWERAYGPGGLVQYQSFIPTAHAAAVFREQLARARAAGLVPYMGIFKRHRPDSFLVSYGVDGYSLGLDFQVTAANRARLWRLAAELDPLVVAAGGRFYLAKDSTLGAESFAPFLAEARMQRFLALKRACDPEGLLATELSRRLFGRFGREGGEHP